jgi:protein-tyrosine-phosphatase
VEERIGGSAAAGLPGSVLFACTLNAIRSPIAEAYLKHILGRQIYVDSVGVRAGEADGFAIAVMDEIGIDLTKHRSKSFDELEDTTYDLVITLSPEAHHRALELTRTMAVDVELWNTMDPTIVHGSREQRLDAYRQVRDSLIDRISARFPMAPRPQ